jgi:hypothetical protein
MGLLILRWACRIILAGIFLYADTQMQIDASVRCGLVAVSAGFADLSCLCNLFRGRRSPWDSSSERVEDAAGRPDRRGTPLVFIIAMTVTYSGA